MDAEEARERLSTRSRPRARTHTPADVALVLSAPILLYVGPVVAATSWVGIGIAVVGMFVVITVPTLRRGRADEPLVPRSAGTWALASGVMSLVSAYSLWLNGPGDQTVTVLLVALLPIGAFVVAMVMLYRRPLR